LSAVFVLDASATLPWCFKDEATSFTEGLLKRMAAQERAVAPAHWPLEVLNTLIQAKLRGRVQETDIHAFLLDLRSLDIQVESHPTDTVFDRIRALAEKHRLTAYDAAYLELAKRVALPLATLDSALVRAAEAEGVRMVG
jgi:predicted nucleic acid-binding protein